MENLKSKISRWREKRKRKQHLDNINSTITGLYLRITESGFKEVEQVNILKAVTDKIKHDKSQNCIVYRTQASELYTALKLL